jgi:hypothetical protein
MSQADLKAPDQTASGHERSKILRRDLKVGQDQHDLSAESGFFVRLHARRGIEANLLTVHPSTTPATSGPSPSARTVPSYRALLPCPLGSQGLPHPEESNVFPGLTPVQ